MADYKKRKLTYRADCVQRKNSRLIPVYNDNWCRILKITVKVF
jgi:hypothetical protein